MLTIMVGMKSFFMDSVFIHVIISPKLVYQFLKNIYSTDLFICLNLFIGTCSVSFTKCFINFLGLDIQESISRIKFLQPIYN